MATRPARLGLREPLLARYAAAGWLDGSDLRAPAAGLLAEAARGPDPGGARSRLASIIESGPAMAADLLSEPALGRAAVAIAGASRALSEVAAADPAALRTAAAGEIPSIPALPADADLPEAGRHLRTSVRRALLAIAVGDLTGRLSMPEVGRALSDTADGAARAAADTALRYAGTTTSMAMIAMSFFSWASLMM